jgi:hypothetical protein
MTDDALQPHVGSLVVVKFVGGHEVLGKLVDDAPLPGIRYAIEQLGGTSWTGIPDASAVEWLRPLTEPPETIN